MKMDAMNAMDHARKIAALVVALAFGFAARAAEVVITAPAEASTVEYGLRRLTETLTARGDTVRRQSVEDAATLVVRATGGDAGPEGFTLSRQGSALVIDGGDSRGAMYGLLDVADQVRRGTALAAIAPRTVRARLPFRAIKFNLPFAAYRTSPALEQHQDTCRDPRFWEAFLDMMAENRFNALTLWSLHPFQYLVVPHSFPEAQTFSDEQMRAWHALWTQLFAMAKERGIDTYLINWNIFVSPAFARAHHVATYSIDWQHFGEGDKSPIIVDYTRECVTQVINEYPDLTGLGVSLGERMGGQTPDERRAWLQDTFFAGIAAADRPIKFIYRAPLSADTGSGGTTSEDNDRATRAQLESLRGNPNIIAPVHLEFKYNWSHGHSSSHLFIVHGGRITGIHWTPKPENYDIVWTVRNEDFYVLRWGEPGFIREFIANNAHAYVGGALIGSEMFIPAKDYITNEGRHRTWRYLFERNWLGWALWGRLLYQPDTPDAELAALFAERYGAADAPDLLRAWTLASRTPLRFASFHQGTSDHRLYTEAFSAWQGTDQAWRFFDIDEFINHPVLDTTYVNIADFVAAGGHVPADKTSPLQLADILDRDLAEAMKLVAAVRARGHVSPTLDFELTDIECWNAYGRYFAEKLRGGVALATFRAAHDPAQQAAAVTHLEAARDHWKVLAQLGRKYNWPKILFHTAESFSWERFLPDVEYDIEVAKGAPPRTQSKDWGR